MDFDVVSYLLGKKRGSGSIGVKYEVVEELPTTGEDGVIYLVPKTTSLEDNVYNEYMYINDNWELIGDTEADLTDYVKNTDYATTSVGGVIKTNPTYYGTKIYNGALQADTKTYQDYGTNLSNDGFVSKGTLENVITGKGLVSNIDYANDSTAGVIKTSSNYATNMTDGVLYARTRNYSEYTSAQNGAFIGKGTLEAVIAGKGLQTQYNTMPTASVDNLGQIVQYTGTTDSTYTNGYFYECVSDGGDPATYSWNNINVQTASSGGSLPLFYSSTDRFDFDVSNDVEPGIYISKNQRFMLYVKALEGTTWDTNGYFGFFIVLKKYSEAQVNEPFIVMLTQYGSIKQWIKTNDSYGITNTTLSGTLDWVSQQQVLTKDNNRSYTPSNNYNPSTKLYTDKTHYENMSGYDATKTQVLKNINGTLTWVDEV